MVIFAQQDDYGWVSTEPERAPVMLDPYSGPDSVKAVVDDIWWAWDAAPPSDNIDCLSW